MFGGRAAYVHVGALIGTIMVWNVFFHIIPGQKQMVAEIRAGKDPDPTPGIVGKQRSVHNTYFTLPVLFIMISNHYPMTYGAKHGWAILAVIMLAGALIRQYFVLRHVGQEPRRAAGGGDGAARRPRDRDRAEARARPAAGRGGEGVTFAQVQPIMKERCTVCHAEKPTFAGFAQPPGGLMLDTPDQVKAAAQRIHQQTIATPGDADRQPHQDDRRGARAPRQVARRRGADQVKRPRAQGSRSAVRSAPPSNGERVNVSTNAAVVSEVHPVDEVLPSGKLFVLGLQHVLVMYAGAVAVPLILGGALKLPKDQIALLINADLFACGVVTLIQALGVWKFGIRLPVMMGVTFASVGPMLAMGDAAGGGSAGLLRHLRLGDRRRHHRHPDRAAGEPHAAALPAGRDRDDHRGDRHLADARRDQLGGRAARRTAPSATATRSTSASRCRRARCRSC